MRQISKHERGSRSSPSVRMLRVGEQLRHILSELLVSGAVRDDILARYPISVTEVRMSPDLRHASVYIKPLLGREEEQILKALEANRGFLQSRAASQLRLKFAARLRFIIDDSFEVAAHINKLLSDPKVAADISKPIDEPS